MRSVCLIAAYFDLARVLLGKQHKPENRESRVKKETQRIGLNSSRINIALQQQQEYSILK